MKTAAAKVVASNLRSDEAALKVAEAVEPPADLVAEAEVPVAEVEEPVWVAVTKPEEEEPVAVALVLAGNIITCK